MTRIARPLPITVISIFLVVSPFLNLYEFLFFGSTTHWLFVRHDLSPSSVAGFLMVLVPVLSGIGIYNIRRWGWYLYLAFSLSILCFGFYRIYAVHSLFAACISILNFSIVIVSLYLVSKNVRKPYFSNEFRGWRLKKRVPLVMTVKILGEGGRQAMDTLTQDLSEAGTLVELTDGFVLFNLGDTLSLELSVGGSKPMVIRCTIMQRTDTEGGTVLLGLRFDSPDRVQRAAIAAFIRTRYTPRYRYSFPVSMLSDRGRRIEAKTENISTRGCYVADAELAVAVGDVIEGSIYLHDEGSSSGPVSLAGIVTWVNDMGLYGKPRGFGMSFTRIKSGRLAFYRLMVMASRKADMAR